MIDGKPSYYIKPLQEQAGIYPLQVGEVFRTWWEKYPGLKNFDDEESVNIALTLPEIAGTGLDRFISSFLPGNWPEVKGVPLAFVKDDLINAGFSGTDVDAPLGLLELFQIELVTPEFTANFPDELVLHVEVSKGVKQKNLLYQMTNVNEDGLYKLEDVRLVLNQFGQLKNEFGPPSGFFIDPTRMRLTKLTGFNVGEALPDLPSIVGTMLIHHVSIGSFRVVSGWQWIGRPHGLHGTQQAGFVQ